MMNIRTDIPQIAALRESVENATGIRPRTHADFIALGLTIERKLKEHISESTLERVWGYSTRGYDTVSKRTLDVLARISGHPGWEAFCKSIGADEDSGFIDDPSTLDPETLPQGARLKLCWQPDRTVILRHLDGARFTVEHNEHSKLSEGIVLTCKGFRKGSALYMDLPQGLYVAGKEHGITSLEII